MKLTDLLEASTTTIKLPPATGSNNGDWRRTMLFRCLIHSTIKLVFSHGITVQPPHSTENVEVPAGTYQGVITDLHISRVQFKFDKADVVPGSGEGLFFAENPALSKIIIINPLRHTILKVLLSYVKTVATRGTKDRMTTGLLEVVVLLRRKFDWTELEAIQKSVEELLDESK